MFLVSKFYKRRRHIFFNPCAKAFHISLKPAHLSFCHLFSSSQGALNAVSLASCAVTTTFFFTRDSLIPSFGFFLPTFLFICSFKFVSNLEYYLEHQSSILRPDSFHKKNSHGLLYHKPQLLIFIATIPYLMTGHECLFRCPPLFTPFPPSSMADIITPIFISPAYNPFLISCASSSPYSRASWIK